MPAVFPAAWRAAPGVVKCKCGVCFAEGRFRQDNAGRTYRRAGRARGLRPGGAGRYRSPGQPGGLVERARSGHAAVRAYLHRAPVGRPGAHARHGNQSRRHRHAAGDHRDDRRSDPPVRPRRRADPAEPARSARRRRHGRAGGAPGQAAGLRRQRRFAARPHHVGSRRSRCRSMARWRRRSFTTAPISPPA